MEDNTGTAGRWSELLAPAGSPEAALAAFQYGADAIYLGLTSLSARAEAVNFTPEQLMSVAAYAHSLAPRRAVYVAVNTLVRDDEAEDVLDALDICSEAGVDGVILQDYAVFSLLRANFPRLQAHASTQMAVHNIDGARALAELGFSRVVLARELTLGEIRRITASAPIETEVFIHGALCYGYSGLCLFSALRLGRSGNRGRCAYCCRSEYMEPGGGGRRAAFPFSMRDLFLLDGVRDLRDAGVASLKIEGRMKSPLYVAAVTDLYRRKLDGLLDDADAAAAAISDMQTVFSRPTTRLYFDGRHAAPEGIIDPSAVGHRGAPAGRVQTVRRGRDGRRWLHFAPQRPLEVHDGLQIEFPGAGGGGLRDGRPYGFAIETMRLAGETHPVFSAPSRSRVEILLPQDAPVLPDGAKVFCSSSQAVKRRFAIVQPRAADMRAAFPLKFRVRLAPDAVSCEAECESPPLRAAVSSPGSFAPANKPEMTAAAVRKAFARLGDTRWSFASLELEDPHALYVPASVLNDARRRLCEALDVELESARAVAREARHVSLRAEPAPDLRVDGPVLKSAKVTVEHAPATFDGCGEIVVALTAASCRDPDALVSRLGAWRAQGVPVRVALPLILRGDEPDRCETAVRRLLAESYVNWECGDIAGLHLLRRIGGAASVTADGTFYAFNRLSASFIRGLGIASAVAPAETDDDQLVAAAAYASGWLAVPMRWRPPLFISETRPAAPWETPGVRHFEMEDRRGWRCTVDAFDGRWLTRDVNPIDRSASFERFRAAGLRLFRYDYTD